MSAPVAAVNEQGLQWQRTTLAWRRSTLSAACRRGPGRAPGSEPGTGTSPTVPALLALTLALALLAAAQLRERQLRRDETGRDPAGVARGGAAGRHQSHGPAIAVMLGR